MSELVENGITTVVGLLGTDGITRSVDNLYAKTRVLCEEGVSAYMLTGAYGYPYRLSQVKQTGTSYS